MASSNGSSKFWTIAAVLGLLIFGALNTLTTKIQFTMKSAGADGKLKLFEKPWFAVFNMFAAMSCVLIVHYIQASKKSKGPNMDSSPKFGPSSEPMLKKTADEKPMSDMKAFLYVSIPATFDLAGSGLIFVGLLYVSASVWQMLRGSMIVFSALISMVALGKKLYGFHWLGIFNCVIGICCVGGANILNTSGGHTGDGTSPSDAYFGMGLVVLGQVVTASQMVAEEKLLKDIKLPAMQIVGFEGVWGVIQMVVIVFPILQMMPGSDNGHGEDTRESIEMLKNSPPLLGLVCIYLFSCATYNMSGMAVTASLSAVHRTMLEASRTAVIWGYDLGVYYFVSKDIAFGESWMPYSWLQLVGFGFLVFGQAIYSATLIVPCCFYPEPEPIQWESPAALRNIVSPMPSPQRRPAPIVDMIQTP